MATHPYLALLQYDLAATYTDLMNLYSLKDADYTVGAGNKTHLGSTNQRKRQMAGWITMGNVSATGEYTAAAFTLLLSLLRVTKTFRIQFEDGSTATNGSTFTWSGFLSKLGTNEFTREQDDPIEIAIAITVDGDTVTYTAAA